LLETWVHESPIACSGHEDTIVHDACRILSRDSNSCGNVDVYVYDSAWLGPSTFRRSPTMSESCSAALMRLAPQTGRTAAPLAGVEFFRADEPEAVGWVLYDASIIFVLQGAKRGQLGDRTLHYAEGSHLVLPLSVPLQSTIQVASPDRPFLAVTISVDPGQIASLVHEGGQIASDPPGPDPIAVGDTTDEMKNALIRLLRSMDSESDRRILAPAIVREIHYRVLRGPHGALLHAAARETGTIAQVAASLRLIHERYDHPLSVGELARAAHMAESTFFAAFRSITGTTPIQHLKAVRLNRARTLLTYEGVSVAEAARRTGYRSRSQFSRDFSARFGTPPSAAK